MVKKAVVKKAATKKSATTKQEKPVEVKKVVVPQPKTQKDHVNVFVKELDLENTTYEEAVELFLLNYRGIFADKNDKEVKGVFRYYCKDEGQFKEPEYTAQSLDKYIAAEPVAYEAKTIDLDNIDAERFVPLKTNTAFDIIASKRNGLMKGTAYILTGESGAGKTTMATNIGDYIKEADPTKTCGFISGEMDEDDWTEECLDNPRLAALPTVFLLNYLDAPNYMDILMQGLTSYDYVILDSFEVVIDQLKDRFGWTGKKAETELIELLRKAAKQGTTIMCIQQYTKGGSFVGSNKIKHLLTGMLFVMFDKHGDRYVTFVKNRRGGHMVRKHLYFTKNKQTGRLEFDGTRFENDQRILEHNQGEANKLMEEQGILDEDFIKRAAELAESRLALERERKLELGLKVGDTFSRPVAVAVGDDNEEEQE